MRRLTLAIATALAIAGCGSSADAPERAPDADLRFEFVLLAGENEIDQTITIENLGDASFAPVLEYTALDAAGEPMPDIDVRVALIEYELPPKGESQQWVRVTELAPLTTVPAGGKKTIRLPRDLRGGVIGSVKPYFSR